MQVSSPWRRCQFSGSAPQGRSSSDSIRVAANPDLNAVHGQSERTTGVLEQAGTVEAESGGPCRGIGEEHGCTIAQTGKTTVSGEGGVEQGLEGSRPRGMTLGLCEERSQLALQCLVRLVDHGVC